MIQVVAACPNTSSDGTYIEKAKRGIEPLTYKYESYALPIKLFCLVIILIFSIQSLRTLNFL